MRRPIISDENQGSRSEYDNVMGMTAELKRLHSPAVHELKAYVPDIADNFAFLLQAMIAPQGGDGEEAFDILVCTPKWLTDHHHRGDIVPGRHHLIVFEYNYPNLKNMISKYCAACSGETWNEIAGKLSGLGRWEFEDYHSTLLSDQYDTDSK